jgi:elongation factor G
VHAGDIGAVAKLTHTLTGDTLCDKGHPVSLPGPVFPSPLFAVAANPRSKADQAKLGSTLTRICEEDPTLHWRQESSTRQTILEGMGEAHVNIAVCRMENRFDVGVETSIPKVPYRETITRVNADQYRHKKQTGGAGQFAEVHMRLEPLPRDTGFEYEWKVFGGRISRSFESSIEKGIKQVMGQGVIAGYPVVDIKAAVYDGKEHPYTGDIMGDLNTKRARVQGMGQRSGKSIITALAPLAEMQRYATDLRSLTQGRGVFSMELDHYEDMPAHLAQAIIEAHEREKETK